MITKSYRNALCILFHILSLGYLLPRRFLVRLCLFALPLSQYVHLYLFASSFALKLDLLFFFPHLFCFVYLFYHPNVKVPVIIKYISGMLWGISLNLVQMSPEDELKRWWLKGQRSRSLFTHQSHVCECDPKINWLDFCQVHFDMLNKFLVKI